LDFQVKDHNLILFTAQRTRILIDPNFILVTYNSAQERLKRGAEPLQAVHLQCFHYHTAYIKFTQK